MFLLLLFFSSCGLSIQIQILQITLILIQDMFNNHVFHLFLLACVLDGRVVRFMILTIALLSGREVILEVDPECRLRDIKQAAKGQFDVSLGKLLTQSGEVLQHSIPIGQQVMDGEIVTATVRPDALQLMANGRAFCALRNDGSLKCWGNPFTGGDSSLVDDQLVNVRSVKGALGKRGETEETERPLLVGFFGSSGSTAGHLRIPDINRGMGK